MAEVDCFLKLKGVEGESADAKHKGEIELESWSFNAGTYTAIGITSGRGFNRVALEPFCFAKRTDKASAKLLVACCTGEHFASAVLVCRKAGKERQEFLTITLSPVIVSSYRSDASGADVIPLESIELRYAKIEIKYREQKADGTLGGEIVGGWDVATRKKL